MKAGESVWEQEFLEELTRYIGFTPDHARTLRALLPVVEPAFEGVVDRFYVAIMENDRARSVFTGGAEQIARQKVHLRNWLKDAFGGVYDVAYLTHRARIGRAHVRIRLDQRYMFSAMNLVREGLHGALSASQWAKPDLSLAHAAIDKICDLELAIMLETYAEDHLANMRARERLASLGQVAGFIGHELRNPLAVMETSLHLLKKRVPPGDDHIARHLTRLGDQVSLSGSIITDLLELTRDRPIERSPTALRGMIEETLREAPLVASALVALDLDEAMDPVWIDESQFRLLIVNLVTNAAQAMRASEGERRITLRATREGDRLILTVEDNGPGISDEIRQRLFEPLTTTHDKGLGLGLALCRRIVEKHEGEIRASNRESGGARFEVSLPDCFRAAP